MEKNSIIDNQVENSIPCRKESEPVYGPSTIRRMLDVSLLGPATDEEKAELKKAYEKYGSLASQNSFKLAVPNLSDEQIKKRIVGQFEYVKEIMRSNYKLERKKELVISAIGGAINFALGTDRLDIYLFLGEQLVKNNISIWEQK